MSGGFQRFENRLESMISGVFARAFRSAVQPVEVSAALQREVDNNAQILSRDRRLVPNDFTVELSRQDLDRLGPYAATLTQEMAESLRDHAEAQSYVFPGPVRIAFELAEDLPTGRLRVRSRAQAKVTSNATHTQVGRASAYLDINGTRHPLTTPGAVVGRGTDADVRINDPGVSRRHIEFRVGTGRPEDGYPLLVSVRDLGSTNGMLVDGQKVAQSPVDDGTVVRIGNTSMTVRLIAEGA